MANITYKALMIPKELHEKIKKKAKDKGLTMTEFIKQLLK